MYMPRIILGLLILAMIIVGIDTGFRLMNMPSTIAFAGGVLLLVTSIGAPIEVLYKYFSNKTKNK
jgi:hypothetical protein